jgi:cytochrome c oxidase assembly factor CtaG
VSPTLDAGLRSWPFDPWLLAALILTTGVYLRGWRVLRWRDPQRWHSGPLWAFLGGLAAVYLALASPIEPFSALLLQVHMLQHLLLMMAAPPLLWLGAPLFPLLRGLPRPIRTFWVIPLLSSAPLRRLFARLTHPLTALALFVAATWLWHLPPTYDLALHSNGWHYLQHLSFLGTALLFWYPVVRPYPARPRWSSWLLIPYLLVADVSNTILSALLTFSDHVLYPYYAEVPRLGRLSALEDQSAAGVLMWVPGSIAFLLPLFWISVQLLSGPQGNGVTARQATSTRIPLPLLAPARPPFASSSFDLLRVPLVGRFLKWRHARLCFQLPLLLLAVAVIYDGLCGPAVGPMNLAGVLPWIHWRGLVVFGLLVLGNVFCMACPFMVPRVLARRFFPQPYTWPRRLRNKWLAVLLLLLFLWAYEAFALWDSPWWTAWIALGYFIAALGIDSCFRGAAFCKYLCPIGQFNFVQSLVSPWEVKVRDTEVCTGCKTKDCIRGRSTPTNVRGCELHLFVPRKSSNLDCTLCLDCIHACPHDNIGIVAGAPAAELWHDPLRSGVGRFGKRLDVAALVLVLVFGAFANAAGMVGPMADLQDRLQVQWGQQTRLWSIGAYYLFALVLLPMLAVGGAVGVSRWWAKLATRRREVAARFVYALVPLGFAMWLSHYSFHLLTSYDAAIPPIERFASELGGNRGTAEWVSSCCRPVMDWIPRLEILCLDVGLLLSLYTGYRIALAGSPERSRALKALAPWAVLILLLFATGVWIVLQPMQMRGTMLMAG